MTNSEGNRGGLFVSFFLKHEIVSKKIKIPSRLQEKKGKNTNKINQHLFENNYNYKYIYSIHKTRTRMEEFIDAKIVSNAYAFSGSNDSDQQLLEGIPRFVCFFCDFFFFFILNAFLDVDMNDRETCSRDNKISLSLSSSSSSSSYFQVN